MSFCHKYWAPMSGNTYDLLVYPEMTAHGEETRVATDLDAIERKDGTSQNFSTEVIEEKIKANLELLHDLISTLTQKMNELIRGNSARVPVTLVSSSKHHSQTDPEPLNLQR